MAASEGHGTCTLAGPPPASLLVSDEEGSPLTGPGGVLARPLLAVSVVT